MVEEKVVITGSGGGKGGGGGSSPVEASDNLHSHSVARLVDLISEGEIEGLVNGLASIYLDDTPLASSTGTHNFQGIKVEWRNGTQQQTYIPGFPAVENGLPINVQLRQGTPFVRDLTNLELTRVRVDLSVSSLMKSDTSSGNTDGYEVQMAIDLAVDGGPFQEQMVITWTGKTTSKYARTYSVNLPPASSHWSLRVRRLTANADSAMIADQTNVESITEVIDGKFTYPNSAVIGLQVNSEQFQSIPRRAYHIRGIKVRVPTNYDPESRHYSGVWDGSFKRAWTNNPAWIFFDLITHTRYGLGDRITTGAMDHWALYDIARYCDQMVPDGFGGEEPRFTINVHIVDRENAYDLIQKLASVFQGMAYYASGFVTAVADQPKDTVVAYTNSDVLEGRFHYSGTPRSTRYNVALVGWQDMSNFGRQEIEYVPDPDGLARYGYNEVQMTAFGCTSRGQAHRAGKWALLTSNIETQTCTFTVGLKGLKSRPGDIIEIADEDLIGEPKGGLIAAATLNTITTDRDFEAKPGDTLKVMLPTGVLQSRTIASIAGRKVTVTQNFTEIPQAESTWAVDGEVRLQMYKVLGIVEQEEGTQYELKCLEYRPDKYDAIANNTRLEPRPVTLIPPSVQPPPENVRLSQRVTVNQGLASTTGIIAWDQTPNAIAYEGAWRRNEGEWVRFLRTGNTSIELPNIVSGRYVAQVRAINARDIRSIPAFSTETELQGKDTPPPVVTFLRTGPLLWGIEVSWGFPQQGAEDVQRTELWVSLTPDREDASKLADLAYPQAVYNHVGLMAAQDFWYWVRLVDRTGNFGDFYPEGPGVHGASSAEANEYLDAIRDEVLTTDLADQLIDDKVSEVITDAVTDMERTVLRKSDEALELSNLLTNVERYLREDEDAQTVNKIEVLDREVNENVRASIEVLQEIVTTEDAALAQQITRLDTKVDENQSVVEQRLTSLSNADVSLAQAVLDLKAEVGDDIAATVRDLQQVVATADQALAQSITELEVKVTDDIAASITDLQQVVAAEDAALAQSITELESFVTEDVSAAISQLAQTVADKDSALAQEISSLATTVSDNQATAKSSLTALANQDVALANQITSLTSRTGTNEANISTTASTLSSTNNKLSSLYTVKTSVTSNGRRYWAGIGLGVENNPGGPGFISQILLQADRVALLNTTNNGVTVPFAVQGGQVFMNNALIQDASITVAKIADLNVTNAKIANGAITNAKIGDAQITNAKIADAQITTAKIGTAQIDRLRLVNGSATAAVTGDFGTISRHFSYSWVTDGSLVINLPEGGEVLVFARIGFVGALGSNPRGVQWRILVAGAEVSAALPDLVAPVGDSFSRYTYNQTLIGMGGAPAGNVSIQLQSMAVGAEWSHSYSLRLFVLSRHR